MAKTTYPTSRRWPPALALERRLGPTRLPLTVLTFNHPSDLLNWQMTVHQPPLLPITHYILGAWILNEPCPKQINAHASDEFHMRFIFGAPRRVLRFRIEHSMVSRGINKERDQSLILTLIEHLLGHIPVFTRSMRVAKRENQLSEDLRDAPTLQTRNLMVGRMTSRPEYNQDPDWDSHSITDHHYLRIAGPNLVP